MPSARSAESSSVRSGAGRSCFEVHEVTGEVGPGVHVGEDVGDLDPRHQPGHAVDQRLRGRRHARLEGGEPEPITVEGGIGERVVLGAGVPR